MNVFYISYLYIFFLYIYIYIYYKVAGSVAEKRPEHSKKINIKDYTANNYSQSRVTENWQDHWLQHTAQNINAY